MSSRFRKTSMAAALCGVLVLPACAMSGSAVPAAAPSSVGALHTMSGGQGGGGGPAQIPPPATVDAAAWFIYVFGPVTPTGPAPSIDFDNIQNQVQGAISIGATRTASVVVYNTSKKTPLAITSISLVGPNPGDFTVTAASVQSALSAPIPANKSAAVALPMTFSPTAEGVRTASLRLVSNAGTVLVPLTGAGLPNRPILTTTTSLGFLPASAPANITISNSGGQTLILKSGAFGGANPGAFALTVANAGQSNCFAGAELGPHQYCQLAIGLTAAAKAPASAFLAIVSNDPVNPTTKIQLTLSP